MSAACFLWLAAMASAGLGGTGQRRLTAAGLFKDGLGIRHLGRLVLRFLGLGLPGGLPVPGLLSRSVKGGPRLRVVAISIGGVRFSFHGL